MGDGPAVLLPCAHATVLADAIPAASLAVVPDTGHCPMLERPGAFHDILLPVLDG